MFNFIKRIINIFNKSTSNKNYNKDNEYKNYDRNNTKKTKYIYEIIENDKKTDNIVYRKTKDLYFKYNNSHEFKYGATYRCNKDLNINEVFEFELIKFIVVDADKDTVFLKQLSSNS